jgi:hypothetical protein
VGIYSFQQLIPRKNIHLVDQLGSDQENLYKEGIVRIIHDLNQIYKSIIDLSVKLLKSI